MERKHFIKQTKKIAKALDVPKTEAAEYFQTERGKIKKEGQEKKINVAPGTQGLVEKIAEKLAAAFKK